MPNPFRKSFSVARAPGGQETEGRPSKPPSPRRSLTQNQLNSHTLPNQLPTTVARNPLRRFRSLPAIPSTSLHLPSPLANYKHSTAPQKARIENRIVHSDHRPNVSAADRLFCWTTPFAIQRHTEIFNDLPPELADYAHSAIRGTLAPNSKSSYAAGLLRFTQFCDRWDIPEPDRMPASYALLCAFVGKHKGTRLGGSIKNWLSGLKSWHDINDAPWNGDHRWVKMARISANKEGTAHKKPLCAPVSIEHLLPLRKAINLSDPFHAAVWAVALCTFFGCCRLGELVVTRASAFDTKYNVLRATHIKFQETRGDVRSVHFRVPWTKTTKEEGAAVILTARDDDLCPRRALQNHLNINSNPPSGTSLFAYRHGSAWKHMLKHEFLEFCTQIWDRVSLAHIHGHSFRIGGAVELLLAGVPPEIVAATRGWTSLAFLLYWHRMEEILPLSTSRAYKKTHFDELTALFEQFCIANNIPRNLITASDSELEI